MTLKEIVSAYLRDHGYDGLWCDDECACELDDLMPCDHPGVYCEPGYLLPGDEDYDFHIGPEKPLPSHVYDTIDGFLAESEREE